MKLRTGSVLLLAVAFSAIACSSSETKQSSDGGATDAGAEGSDAMSDVMSMPAALKAPTVSMVAPMAGGLHVMWKNGQADCDAIEGERKSVAEAYKVVFTVPDGSVDNKHDAPLTAGTAYTYRLRCKKGSEYSPYSNEKTATP